MPKVRIIAIDDHPRRKARLEFDVDFSTGATSDLTSVGINPDQASSDLKEIAEANAVHFGWQQSYPTPDPMRTPVHLAWHLMARGWRLEGELVHIAMPRPEPVPEGAIA